jgi:hypothetical protein
MAAAALHQTRVNIDIRRRCCGKDRGFAPIICRYFGIMEIMAGY